MSVKGSVLPVRVVHCEACGRRLERKTYWRRPRCSVRIEGETSCAVRADASRRRDEKAERKRAREQARRYRVLASLLAWQEDEFDRNAKRLARDPAELRFLVGDLLRDAA
jgi:hypothetical protein